ncbi:MAG TPA: hypothetical protein VD930_02115 [Gemmatimonadales bacterium]|nr:hypothetical protein [Gemmatimonadales bacterium]
MRSLVYLTVAVACIGCTSTRRGYDPELRAAPRAAGYAENGGSVEEPSLFKMDTEVLSDSAIRRILEYRLELPSSSRLAVLQLGTRSVEDWRWSTDARPGEVSEVLLKTLRSSPRVRTASLLPSLLVPRQRTVGYLREAAARYQADLLLVYRSDCRTFERSRFLASDAVKATCVAEAVLIDTRTGIVPFTASASRDFEAKKSKTDTNFRETVRRAEVEAVSAGLADLGSRVVEFLSPASAGR